MAKTEYLSPEILFHFTNKAGLFGILEKDFRISYSRERVKGVRGGHKEFAIPMVSFCDLRLSEVKSHINKYGAYGIGLTKRWANRSGLNPVFYLNADSPLSRELFLGYEELLRKINRFKDEDIWADWVDSFLRIIHLFSFLKNYEGELKRSRGLRPARYRFADEREWRFVPENNVRLHPFVRWEDIDTPDKKRALEAEYEATPLLFTPEDIQYLVIETDAERLELITHLELVKGRYDADTRRRLASRILTSEQIHNDV